MHHREAFPRYRSTSRLTFISLIFALGQLASESQGTLSIRLKWAYQHYMAIVCPSVRPSVCLSVSHTLDPRLNGSSFNISKFLLHRTEPCQMLSLFAVAKLLVRRRIRQGYCTSDSDFVRITDQADEKLVLVNPNHVLLLARPRRHDRQFIRQSNRLFSNYCVICILYKDCLLYTSPSPRDGLLSRMPSSA